MISSKDPKLFTHSVNEFSQFYSYYCIIAIGMPNYFVIFGQNIIQIMTAFDKATTHCLAGLFQLSLDSFSLYLELFFFFIVAASPLNQ